MLNKNIPSIYVGRVNNNIYKSKIEELLKLINKNIEIYYYKRNDD